MISVIIAVLFAALVYALCLALGLPAIVGLIAAILVLLAGIPTGATASADDGELSEASGRRAYAGRPDARSVRYHSL